jgi:23S rRNA (guanosine2251-2'-O)-methyltransferase
VTRRSSSRRSAGRNVGAPEMALGGRRAVAEAVRAGRAAKILAVRGSRATEGLRAVLAEADRAGVAVEWTSRDRIDGLGLSDHQGVVAMVSLPPELDERELRTRSFEPDAVVVVLDGISDPQNLGACARSAEAAGVSLLVMRKRRAASPTAAAVRASAGALLHLPVARVANLTRVLEHLAGRGFFLVGLDHRADLDVYGAAPPPRPVAVVVGSEGVGISRLVRESCDQLVAIPMVGRTSSLNASAALAVALFAYILRSPPATAEGGPAATMPVAGVAQPGSASDL